MTIEFIDGFDHYNETAQFTRKWDTGGYMNSSQAGRFGGLCCAMTTGGGAVTLAAVATRTVGLAYKATFGSAASIAILAFYDGITPQIDVRTSNAGVVTVTRNGTVLATASMSLSTSTWYYIEFKATIGSATSGSFELRIQGSTVASSSGTNTQNAGATMNRVIISGATSGSYYYDDLYVASEFLGECRVLTNLPTGDGHVSWAHSTGVTNYGAVDENTPNDDTDYNSSSTPGQIDTFTFAAIAPTGSIAAVQTVLTARKDDAGARSICEEVRDTGGTNRDGSNTFTLNSTFGMFREILETDPVTGSAWSTAGVNGTEFGYKELA